MVILACYFRVVALSLGLASKCPLLLTQGREQTTMTVRIRMSATPVGLAQPPIRPNNPGLLVNIHSQKE